MLIMSVLLNGWPTFVDPRTSVEAGCFRLNLSNDPPAPSEHPRDQTEEGQDWIDLFTAVNVTSCLLSTVRWIWFSVSVVCCSAFKVPHLQSYILVFSVCLAPTHRLQNPPLQSVEGRWSCHSQCSLPPAPWTACSLTSPLSICLFLQIISFCYRYWYIFSKGFSSQAVRSDAEASCRYLVQFRVNSVLQLLDLLNGQLVRWVNIMDNPWLLITQWGTLPMCDVFQCMRALISGH